MVRFTKVNLKQGSFKDKGKYHIPMVIHTQANSTMESTMDMASFYGKMGIHIRVTISMELNKDMEYSKLTISYTVDTGIKDKDKDVETYQENNSLYLANGGIITFLIEL